MREAVDLIAVGWVGGPGCRYSETHHPCLKLQIIMGFVNTCFGNATFIRRDLVTVGRMPIVIMIRDPYDWHESLGAPIPGFGYVKDSEALCLVKANRAKEFHMKSVWSKSYENQYVIQSKISLNE
jgi:hypothetical protein